MIVRPLDFAVVQQMNDNADKKNNKHDAKNKSQNEYHKEKGFDKKKRQTDEGKVSVKGQNSVEFDIRI